MFAFRAPVSPARVLANCASCGLLVCLVLLGGCRRGFYRNIGFVSASGPAFGNWHAPPEGCSRDPEDGRPDGQTATVASFFWEDPAGHDRRLRDGNAWKAPDVPQRLDLLRAADGYQVRLKTVKTSGWMFGEKDCTQLEVNTQEQAPSYEGGRSALAGHVVLDCRVKGSAVKADFTFEQCEF